jgi:hypothetical protein
MEFRELVDLFRWPLTWLIVILIMFFSLKKSIARFLDRTRQITRHGIYADSEEENTVIDGKIKAVIEKRRRISLLADFEFLYPIITTEQQQVLQYLQYRGDRIDFQSLQNWGRVKFGDVDEVDSEARLSFLRDSYLLVRNGDSVIITNKGMEFLNFLRDRGYAS